MTMMTLEDKTNDLVGTFQKILESPEPFANQDEKETCQRLVEALPEELVEHAANTSYAYWFLASQPDTCPLEETKVAMAMREARRHLKYMGDNYEKTLAAFTESCQYRKDHQLDLLRICFDKDIDEQYEIRAREMAALVAEDLKKQIVIMRGKGHGDRATMIKLARREEGTSEEGYVMSQIYTADRSTAATEFLSMGREERSYAVMDYNGFASKNAPPFQAQVSAVTLLQRLFPERLQTLVMVEPPFWIRTVLTMLNPFLSEGITARIKHVTGEEEKTKLFSQFMDPEHAIPLLLKDGNLAGPVSLGHFLEDVPFYCIYDDVRCERDILEEEKHTHYTAPDEQASKKSLWGSVSSISSSLF